MGTKKETGASQLQEATFEQLFQEEILPSGHPFKLMPDTVDTALKVAEVDDVHVWKEKALQAYIVTASVGGVDIHGEDGYGPGFVHGMLDIDVVFLTLAWTAQMTGMDLEITEPVPCPGCTNPFTKIPFGNLKVHRRVAPVDGSNAVFEVDGIDKGLPKSLMDGTLYVMDPTWQAARQHVSKKSWETPEIVAVYRTLSTLRFSSKGSKGPPRMVSMQGEGKQMSTKTLGLISEQMRTFVPHFEMHLDLICEKCKEVSVIPFEQGL